MRNRKRRGSPRRAIALALACAGLAAGAAGQEPSPETGPSGEKLVNLDFDNQELTVVIKTIADLTGKNFIYDDRIRGRVTIISPTPIPIDQAYAVFESVLQVKGFTTVRTPGGAIKVIPVRDAKETNVDTREGVVAPPNRDHYVTRLIPLRYIDAESIVATLKSLVSKEAAMAAYPPTNTVILTESASNIRRILAILDAVDVETYRAEIAVIRLEFADASTLATQLAQIYGAEAVGVPTRRPRARRGRGQPVEPAAATVPGGEQMQILTDERTNSLIVLAARGQLAEIREVIAMLDVPITGGGRIHVYYLKHANAEELAQTLSGLLGGTGAVSAPPAQGGQAQAARAQVAELAGGISITADPATNSLVIQATHEGFSALVAVIRQLDIPRPQVLVEALIMEVAVSDGLDLGFNGALRIINGDTDMSVQTLTDSNTADVATTVMGGPIAGAGKEFLSRFLRDTTNNGDASGTTIQGIIRASATNSGTNIISAPHILTSDNEQAEIRIGNNIPIISSRVESAAGQEVGLATSVNVERQDIGVTLRVTPQITEGDTLRLDIFQEISAINSGIGDVGAAEDVGVPLSTRRVENVVVVADGDTVVIGGLISDDYQDSISKVPFLGDIPVLGWAFKTTTRTLRKNNLLVFLTPHIIRDSNDLEKETIRKREEFRSKSGSALELSNAEREKLLEERQQAEAQGVAWETNYGRNPVRVAVIEHEARYPLERMRAIERQQREEAERTGSAEEEVLDEPRYFVQAGVFADEGEAARALTELVDAGFDGTLVSESAGETVFHEIRLGPFDDLEQARAVGLTVERGYGLSPAVLVEPSEP